MAWVLALFLGVLSNAYAEEGYLCGDALINWNIYRATPIYQYETSSVGYPHLWNSHGVSKAGQALFTLEGNRYLQLFGRPYFQDGELKILVREWVQDAQEIELHAFFEEHQEKLSDYPEVLARLALKEVLLEEVYGQVKNQWMGHLANGAPVIVPTDQRGERTSHVYQMAKVVEIKNGKIRWVTESGNHGNLNPYTIFKIYGWRSQCTQAEVFAFFEAGGRGPIIDFKNESEMRSTAGNNFLDGFYIRILKIPRPSQGLGSLYDPTTLESMEENIKEGVVFFYKPSADYSAMVPNYAIHRFFERRLRAITEESKVVLLSEVATAPIIAHEVEHLKEDEWIEDWHMVWSQILTPEILEFEEYRAIEEILSEHKAYTVEFIKYKSIRHSMEESDSRVYLQRLKDEMRYYGLAEAHRALNKVKKHPEIYTELLKSMQEISPGVEGFSLKDLFTFHDFK